jgi:PIN domain nuclease of toxin-antitoxin system
VTRILLDTHAFIWWCGGSTRLTPRATQAIADPGNEIFVSAACLWELATKIRIGKLVFPRTMGGLLLDEVHAERFSAMPISPVHAELAGSLDHHHRDPFDRMLIAQAISEDLTLVSNETLFDQFGVTRLW